MSSRPIGFVREAGGPIQARTEVIHAESLTASVGAIRVATPAGFGFRVSQAAQLIVSTPWGIDWRPMSIASAPTRPYLEFAARISDSTFKQAFASLRVGDEVVIRGPSGRFFLDAHRPAVLVGGGIGITPL
jgi:ferredoxin-NADP reductase